MRNLFSKLTSAAWLLIGGVFLVLIVVFSTSDLAAETGGGAAALAEVLAVSFAACSAVAAALFLVLAGLARLQRRLGGAPASRQPFSLGRLAGVTASLAWVAFVTSPFLGPAVVAGDWREVVTLTALVGGLIIGFFAVLVLAAILLEARKRNRSTGFPNRAPPP